MEESYQKLTGYFISLIVVLDTDKSLERVVLVFKLLRLVSLSHSLSSSNFFGSTENFTLLTESPATGLPSLTLANDLVDKTDALPTE